MIHLASSITENYPWAPAWLASLRAHCNVPYTLFALGHEAPGCVTLPIPPTRCQCPQYGAFVEALALPGDAVVIFTDADMVMQRPFSPEELNWLSALGPDEVALGVNGAAGDTLWDEAQVLGPEADDWFLDAVFPEWRALPIWNFGVAAARLETWRRVHDLVRGLLPLSEWCFRHYAVLQWVLCYVVGRWLRHVLLSRTIHLHGHWGLQPGMSLDAAGNALWEDHVCVFRHAINLTPPKGPALDELVVSASLG